MSLNITVPQPKVIKPKISVFGIGGAGGNALNNMITSNLEGVEFIAANTDAQSLQNSLSSNRIQLGLNTTKGLGAGSFPDRGKAAAEENVNEINKYLDGNNMVFITAGMGGGTGTGAAPVIAKLAKEKDILTVGVVTKPFEFEGKYRMEAAINGIEELKKYVDTLIIIPNQNLFRIANEKTTFESAFKMADHVLHAGVRGITDLITMPGLVNLDFADIKTIMTKMGKAMMGTGEAEGENRAVNACQEAISNPLLDDVSIQGAKGVLVNMTGGTDMTLFEADQAVNEIRKQVDENANIIFGSAFNEDMKGKIRVSVVATGIDVQDDEVKNDVSQENEGEEQEANTPAFFDPQGIEDIGTNPQKIGSSDFKPKINLDNFIQTEQSKVKINNGKENTVDTQNIEASNDNSSDKQFETVAANNFTPIEEEKENTQPTQEIETPEAADDKEESGFSLFRFITGTSKKNKKEEVNQNDKISEEEPEEPKQEEEQEVLDFSFHDNIIEELPKEDITTSTASGDNLKSEDDVLNIPAFFRKKEKNNG